MKNAVKTKKKKPRKLIHIIAWGLIWLPATLFVKAKLNFRATPAPDVKGPYIVIANHNSGWDPALVACSFRRQMYYVAGEHVLRWGLLSWIITTLLAPISRIKGTTDSAAAIGILKTLKAGANVCLFAEGNMSFSGRTCQIHPTVGRLVKMSGASLITYRLSGVYLARPRWSKKLRRGRTYGECINVYTPEMLKGMTAEQVYDAIAHDLHEDAFETQREKMSPYRGKGLAESLETALYICPECGGLATLKSEGDRLFCPCGLDVRYTEYGFFEGGRFSTVAEWDDWQKPELKRLCAEAGDEPIFSDEKQTLSRIGDDHTTEPVAEGTLAVYRDRLVIGDFSLPLDKITAIDIHGRENVVFSSDSVNYEIGSPFSRSGRKYVDACRVLTGSEVTI